jgi:hypothetical protein
MKQSTRKATLLTLLVILFAVGSMLFIVPSVSADKPAIDPVLVRIDGSLTTEVEDLYPLQPWNDFFIITLKDIPFTDPSWKLVGDIYDVTVNPLYKDFLDSQISDGGTHDVEILLLIANKYKNNPEGLFIVQYAQFCDFDGDGEVTGHDTRLISNYMNNPGAYLWTYDLDQDGDIDPDDIHIADSFKGTYEQWITLPIPPTRIAIIDSNPYLIADLWHFSGFGIRR